MNIILDWLQGLDPVAQAALAGIVASVLLQIVKRCGWHPAEEAKAKKWVAAIVASALAAFVVAPDSFGAFLQAWLVAAGASQVWHEGTTKVGLKEAWSLLPAFLGGSGTDTLDDAGASVWDDGA